MALLNEDFRRFHRVRNFSSYSYDKAKEFLENLMSCIRFNNLLIIPGNHDVHRIKVLESAIEKISHEETTEISEYTEIWEVFKTRFNEYYSFIEGMNLSFDAKVVLGGCIKDIDTSDGKIRFILLNSSWTCLGNNDYQNILLGESQLEGLRKASESLGKAKLTIGLSHHPLSWLKISEQKDVLNF